MTSSYSMYLITPEVGANRGSVHNNLVIFHHHCVGIAGDPKGNEPSIRKLLQILHILLLLILIQKCQTRLWLTHLVFKSQYLHIGLYYMCRHCTVYRCGHWPIVVSSFSLTWTWARLRRLVWWEWSGGSNARRCVRSSSLTWTWARLRRLVRWVHVEWRKWCPTLSELI